MGRKNIISMIRRNLTKISPKLSTQIQYLIRKRKFPNLRNPKTFDEKISWLKLYDYPSNNLVIQASDKLKVRDYICSKGLEHTLNDLISVWDSPEEINLDNLPSQFVLKWNNDYGSTFIVTDKAKVKIEEIVQFFKN